MAGPDLPIILTQRVLEDHCGQRDDIPGDRPFQRSNKIDRLGVVVDLESARRKRSPDMTKSRLEPPPRLALVDLSGNGRPDLVAVNRGGNSLVVYLNGAP